MSNEVNEVLVTSASSPEEKDWWEGMNPYRQCCLKLNDPNHGYERLKNESIKADFRYNGDLTKSVFDKLYRAKYPDDKTHPTLGAGTWIKIRHAGDNQKEHWLGVGIWGRVFKSFKVDFRQDDVIWKPEKHSLVLCYDVLDIENTVEVLDAKQHVRIVNTYIPNWNLLRNNFKTYINGSAKIQILLLDYNSPQVAYRAPQLGMSQKGMKDAIRRSIDELSKSYTASGFAELDPARFEVRLFDVAPVTSLYWYDQVCYMGLHWMAEHAIDAPQFRIEEKKNSVLYARMTSHFDSIWKSAQDRRILPFLP